MNNSDPLVSVNIPTLNSENTISECIESVLKQTYKNIEVLVIDGGSRDNTVSIAKNLGATVLLDEGSLLSARKTGILSSSGQFILLLDSDQVLRPNSIEILVKSTEENDMLCLGESAVSQRKLPQKLLNASKQLSQSNLSEYLNPYSGLLLPRFFRASLIKNAINTIKPRAFEIVFDRDHQIIFYESWKLSNKVGFVGDLLYHDEPSSLVTVIKKAYRWGISAGFLRSSDLYSELLKNKSIIRRPGNSTNGSESKFTLFLSTTLITLVKAFPYGFGYLLGNLSGFKERRRLSD
jgi:glycosyltransferase involved in cell wall biosynthesis